MALELKLNYTQSKNGKQLIFKDISNWGEGAIPVSLNNVTSATLTIIVKDNTFVLDLMPKFSLNDPNELLWVVLTQDIEPGNVNSIFDDNIYSIKYKVTTATDEYEVFADILLYFNVKQYVYKIFMNLNDNWKKNLCNQDTLNWANNLWAALTALEYTAYLGNKDRINNNLEFLQKLIKSSALYELNK
jgi:hypothetical protein